MQTRRLTAVTLSSVYSERISSPTTVNCRPKTPETITYRLARVAFRDTQQKTRLTPSIDRPVSSTGLWRRRARPLPWVSRLRGASRLLWDFLFSFRFSLCTHFTLSRCGLSTWIKVIIISGMEWNWQIYCFNCLSVCLSGCVSVRTQSSLQHLADICTLWAPSS